MKQLLNDVQNRLIAEVPAIKFVDFNHNQFELESNVVQWPCVLIDIPSIKWSNQGKYAQIGLAQLVVTYGNMRLTPTSGHSPQNMKDFYLSNIDNVTAIHAALHGWAASPHFAPLIRTTTTTKRGWSFVEIQTTFTTSLYDAAASPNQNFIGLAPNVTGEIL